MEEIQTITFPSAGSHPIQLEGRLHRLDGAGQWPAAVICHPHPLGGGTLRNNVVTAIARAMVEQGIMALRFNFRGVGGSGGQHDNGRGEQDDVAGAIDWLLDQPEVDPWRVFLAGYSFGAWVGLNHAQNDRRILSMAAVGLTAWHYDAEFHRTRRLPGLNVEAWPLDPDFMRSVTRPKLFVSGERDDFAPPEALRRFVAELRPPKSLHILTGTDHFFVGREAEVGELVAGFFSGQ